MRKIVPQRIKNIYHLAQAVAANFFYGFPSRRLKIIGVTGTNGKTTTVQMVARILEEAGRKVAVASTINFKIGEKEWVNKTKFTTLSGFQVQKFIKEAADAGCDYLVLETSSHSLDQYRVWGVKYDTAVITNVTREHLDYHKTMEEYRRAKLRLFKKARVAAVNLNMEKPDNFIEASIRAEKIYGYILENQNAKIKMQNNNSKLKIIKADEINLGNQDTRYKIPALTAGGQDTKFKLNLIGEFNIENSLAAVCVGISEGIDLKTIAQALEKIQGVPGRMEYVPNDKGLNIIIDYAVTPDSLEKLYSLVKTIRSNSQTFASGSRVVSVFGACGERDRGKRPLMGEIVSKYADFIILANEDPYGENPMQIIDEVAAGVKNKKEGENFWKILDRREAIKKALQIAKPGDFVVVTGKGAEETMAVGEKRIPWNDKKVILEVLQEI